MKIKFAHFFISITLASILFSFCSCHEKGCTDPNAINYNSVADEDDGSCITCSGSVDTLGVSVDELIDFNFSGPHYQDTVAIFYLTQLKDKYTYSECGVNQCRFQVNIVSLVNQRMNFTFTMFESGNVFFNWSKNVVVDPFDTLDAGSVPSNIISNPCGFASTGTMSVSTNSTIIYQ